MNGRGVARAVLLAGAVVGGLFLSRAAPRDVTLVYAVGDPAARELEVDILKGGETVRHAELRLTGSAAQVSHVVRLTDGDYVVRVSVARGAGARRVERTITVTESGTIVLPLGP